MKADELKKWIDSLTQDIDFQYRGQTGSICPFTRSEISLSFGKNEVTVHSVEEAMKEPFIFGRSLEEICEELTI